MSREYDNYLLEHRKNVRRALIFLKKYNIVEPDFEFETLHDESKNSTEEYYPYDRYFNGQIIEERSESVKKDFDYAWLHHIHNNPHHWQYWILIEEGEMKPLDMPLEYVIEMICDWWSFGFKNNNRYEIFDWYDKHKNKIIVTDLTRQTIENILDDIKICLDKEVEEEL